MHSPVITDGDHPAVAAASAAAASKARFWDRVARKYASDPIADLAGYEGTLRRVQALLSPDHEVLEIGCGTGSTALRLAAGTRRLVATDVSAEMVAIAREKLAADPLPQLEFRVADADAPVSGPAAWDAVLAFNLLHLVTDLPQALLACVLIYATLTVLMVFADSLNTLMIARFICGIGMGGAMPSAIRAPTNSAVS